MQTLNLDSTITPQAALQALRKRTANPSPAFSWLDLFNDKHAQAFTVAKTAGFDVLDDLAAGIDDAIAAGKTFDSFEKSLVPILMDKGWWGQAPAFDPETGAAPISQLGSTRRLQIIYDTNLRASYAAGQWIEAQNNKADQPYLMYLHGGSLHPRPEHLAWNGTTLPVDDPWWNTHFAPNGWNCSCTVVPISERQFGQMSGAGTIQTEAPASPVQSFANSRTGEVTEVPVGIDPGFANNPGKAMLARLTANKP